MNRRVAPWGLFLLLLAWCWRVYDLWNYIPAYGDALEVAWGIRWYYESLFVQHTSPLFDPLIFHPLGWHTATLAHTPLLFLLGSLLLALGASVALAYNLLALASLMIAFAGARRFMALFSGEFAATCAALIFTFADMRWTRVGGHFNTLFATSLFPWFLYELYQLSFALLENPTRLRKKELESDFQNNRNPGVHLLLAGLVWAAMVHFSLYCIFLILPAFLLWGSRLFSWRGLRWMTSIGVIMLLAATPLLWLYWQATQVDQLIIPSVAHLASWGASVDTLFLPSLMHPLAWIRQLNQSLFTGVADESTIMNFGPITWGLAILGGWGLWRRTRGIAPANGIGEPSDRQSANSLGLIWFTLISMLLALGLILRWNGSALALTSAAPLDHIIWQIGRWVKPWLFDAVDAPPLLQQGIPLPGYLLTALLPFWEAARVVARFALFGGMGLIGLAAIGLSRQSKNWQLLLASVWLLCGLPTTTGNVRLPTQPHPAHAWVAKQPLQPSEGILDLTPNLAHMMDGAIVYATLLHRLPTVSGVGSFAPLPLHGLQKWLISDDNALSQPETAYLLRAYGVRYLLLHIQQPAEKSVWEKIRNNPALQADECFDPPAQESPWNYPICVAEVLTVDSSPQFNLFANEGWSGAEAWGRWAEKPQVVATWVTLQPHEQRLHIRAFPNCLPNQIQSLLIQVNEQRLVEHQWQTCEEWQAVLTIPATWLQVGWNRVTVDFGYALPPVNAADSRTLAAGFSELRIE